MDIMTNSTNTPMTNNDKCATPHPLEHLRTVVESLRSNGASWRLSAGLASLASSSTPKAVASLCEVRVSNFSEEAVGHGPTFAEAAAACLESLHGVLDQRATALANDAKEVEQSRQTITNAQKVAR